MLGICLERARCIEILLRQCLAYHLVHVDIVAKDLFRQQKWRRHMIYHRTSLHGRIERSRRQQVRFKYLQSFWKLSLKSLERTHLRFFAKIAHSGAYSAATRKQLLNDFERNKPASAGHKRSINHEKCTY